MPVPQTPPPAAPPAQTAPAEDATQKLMGKRAPGFTLPDQKDIQVSLSEAKGKWVVLAFYPADMTTGCTFQNRSYSAQRERFTPLNAVAYTISTQDTTSKRAFCQKEALGNTLLSDVGGKVAAAYGVLQPGRGVARRVTFYINPAGKIVSVDTKINVKTAAEDSLATLARLGAKFEE